MQVKEYNQERVAKATHHVMLGERICFLGDLAECAGKAVTRKRWERRPFRVQETPEEKARRLAWEKGRSSGTGIA
jgi:hypothetical protein